MYRRPALAALLLLTATLCACGGDDGRSDAAAPGPATSQAEQWDCNPDSDITQAEWAEHCVGIDRSSAAENPNPYQTIELGTPYQGAAPNDTGSLETITVKSLECGLAELPDAAANPAWDGSDDIPETITATADSGMMFCRITASWQNTGKVPIIGWTDFENLVTADGVEFAADAKAEEATKTINYDGLPSHCSPYLCDSKNPGTPAFDIVKIYQVPVGTTPAVVRWPHTTISSGPVVEFALT